MWSFGLIGIILSVHLFAGSVFAQTTMFPTEAPPGATVTISGEQFGAFQSTEINQVLFNTRPALVQRWEDRLIEVKVPFKATSGPVVLVKGTTKIPAGELTVLSPTIETLSPEKIEPGKVLRIRGKHFGNTAGPKDPNTMFGVNQVWVGGAKAKIQRWRNGKIEVLVPATAKSGDVQVRLASSDPLPNGYCCAPVQYVKSNSLTLTVMPTILAEPLRGPIGTKIVLFSEQFGPKPHEGSGVFINGHITTLGHWEERRVVVHVPLNATTGPLIFKHEGQERALGTFTVLAPKVTKMSPAQGPIGNLLKIQGEHFGMYTDSGTNPFSFLDFDTGENGVTIGGVPAVVFRWNDDRIDVWVPYSAKGGPVVISRGGSLPNADGTCCAELGSLAIPAGEFTVVEPKVESVTPSEAGIDEIVTISGTGFGSYLKGREATDSKLGSNAFLGKKMYLTENTSRTVVLFNGVAGIVRSWTSTEITVQVPRRLLFGIGSMNTFEIDLATGPLLVRRGSWDMLPDGTCCTSKKWVTASAGDFRILEKGMPDQGFFNDPIESNP